MHTLEAVREAAAHIEDVRPDVTVSVYDDGNRALVYMTRRPALACGRCGQELSERPGPRTLLRAGRPYGSHNHLHACGGWNPPAEVKTWIGDYVPVEEIPVVLSRTLARLDHTVSVTETATAGGAR